MSDDELRVVAATALHGLFSTGKVNVPISSMALLARVIAYKLPASLFPSHPAPRFRLTDLARFDAILTALSYSWDAGTVALAREADGLVVLDVTLDPTRAPGAPGALKRKRVVDEDADSAAGSGSEDEGASHSQPPPTPLAALSRELKEVYAILQRSTARGRLLAEQYQSPDPHFEPICAQITKDDCTAARGGAGAGICARVHFRAVIRPHTDPALGHCSYLNTCYSEPTYARAPAVVQPTPTRGAVSLPSGLGAGGRGKEKAPCKYLHYEVDWDGGDGEPAPRPLPRRPPHKLGIGLGPDGPNKRTYGPQWINCDLRRFDYSVLGKFHVIMADPPWDIHMSLPYGTMTDDEMRAMPIPTLQDEGFIFLWVTGRAMEVGRECLRVWGYTRVDEVVWVKTNQLQRVIRTGRTGHWLNHTKEHMLVGVKTAAPAGQGEGAGGAVPFPKWANRGLDTDVLVAEVRETSRKPDEVYGLIERLCPGGRKIEIFGRRHNTRPGWLTLGNQLGADQIFEEDLAARIRAKYPDRAVDAPMAR